MKKIEEKSAMGKKRSGRPRKLWENEDKIGLKSDTLIPRRRGRENQTEKEGEYFVSDLVWGKVRSHPWWPGQILEPSSAPNKAMKYFKKDSYLISYFGDQSFSWIDASNILPFGLYFQEMEKQRVEENFKIAVDTALDDVSRRVECGLACRCLPERVLDRVKGQGVNSEGVQCSRIYYDGDSFPAAASFVHAELVAYLKSLAETSKAAVSRLQFTAVRAQLFAYRRWKRCSEFPLIEKFTRSLENDATDPMALHEVLEVLPEFKKDDAVTVTVKGNSFTKRKHPAAEDQRKKKQCMLESMPTISSCFSNGENTFQEEFDWDMALLSSLKKKRNANGEISVEKVREGDLLPMVNNEAASLPGKRVAVGKLRRVTGRLEKNSSFKSSVRSSSRDSPHIDDENVTTKHAEKTSVANFKEMRTIMYRGDDDDDDDDETEVRANVAENVVTECAENTSIARGLNFTEKANMLNRCLRDVKVDDDDDERESSMHSVLGNVKGEGAEVAENVATVKTLIARSLTVTEIASMMNRGPRDEDDEIVSSLHPIPFNVKGYNVKQEVAPLLEKILKKHGDIGRNYEIECPDTRGRLVDLMCSVYQKLEDTNLMDVTDVELEGMIENVKVLQVLEFDVKWLSDRLEDIRETKNKLKEHSLLEKEEAEKGEAVLKKAEELDEYRKKKSTAKAELRVLKAELVKVKQKNDNLMEKGNAYLNKSLVHGLLL